MALTSSQSQTCFPLFHSNIKYMKKQLDRLGLCFSWDRVSWPFFLGARLCSGKGLIVWGSSSCSCWEKEGS